MNILNVGYGTTNPQTLIHLVQSNVALRLEDPRDNINSIINIDFKRGSGLFGQTSNNDWRLSSSNYKFNIQKYSNDLTCNILSINENGNVNIANDIIFDGNLIKNGIDVIDNISNYIRTIDTNLNNILSTTVLTSIGDNDTNSSNYADYTSNIIKSYIDINDYNVSNYVDAVDTRITGLISTNDSNISNYVDAVDTRITGLISTNDSNISNYVDAVDTRITGLISTNDSNVSNYIFATSNLLNINTDTKFYNTTNYILASSNILSKRITELNADSIANGNINKFIINNKYQNDLEIIGDLTASNLIIYGEKTILYTDIYTTEQLEIENKGTGSALSVKQLNTSYDIFNASNNNSEVFTILNNGNVGIGTQNPSAKLEIIGDINIDGDILPIISNTCNLGSSTNRWKDLYLSGNSIFIDNVVISKNNEDLAITDVQGNYKNLNINSIELNNDGKKVSISLDTAGNIKYTTDEAKTFFASVSENVDDTKNTVTSNYLSLVSNYLNTDYDNKFYNTTNYILDTSNLIKLYIDTNDYNVSNYIIAVHSNISDIINNNDSNISNYLFETSNIISLKINNLTTDNINKGQNNKFIVNNYHDDNLNIVGKLNIFSNSNLVEDIVNIYQDNINSNSILKILDNGKIGIGNSQPNEKLDVNGNINITGNYMVNNEIFKTSQWATKDNSIYYNISNVGIGTENPSSLLSLRGNKPTLKIQDPGEVNENMSSIELINGAIDNISSNQKYSWRIANTSNKYIISSANITSSIKDRFIIDGVTGNIGVNTSPHVGIDSVNLDTYVMNISGSINIDGYLYNNGKKYEVTANSNMGVLSQNMSVQTLATTYRKKIEMSSDINTFDSDGWQFIDNDLNNGFVIKIKPSHISSKILVNLSCHIGFDSVQDSRWWGLKLYRKIGIENEWTEVVGANGNNENGEEGTVCWLSNNLGSSLTTYEYFVANLSGTFFDQVPPESSYNKHIYYTAKWKSKLGNTSSNFNEGKLYLNRPSKYNSTNSPSLSSSWTVQEIWQLGTPFVPAEGSHMITFRNDNVGIGNTNPLNDLDVLGDINITGNYKVNNEIFKTSQWTTKGSSIYINSSNVGIGTENPNGLLSLRGNKPTLKIQDPGEVSENMSSIELINGTIDNISSNQKYSWRIINTSNKYVVSSANITSGIKDRFIIDGVSGNIGINTSPHVGIDSVNLDTYKMNVFGSINIDGYLYKNGKKYEVTAHSNMGVLAQNMSVQTLATTYRKKIEMSSDINTFDSDGWQFIDNDLNNGFIIRIKPSHISSKILVNLSCHIGFDSVQDSRWWGLKLYRKVEGNNEWNEVVGANGNNENGEEGTVCWLSNNLGSSLTTYEYFVANVSGSFFDQVPPEAAYNKYIYYTVKWKSKLGNTSLNFNDGKLYLNRPSKYNSTNSPSLSSSWTVQEIWQLGTPFIPAEGSHMITFKNENVGIGNTNPENDLDVLGDINITGKYKINNIDVIQQINNNVAASSNLFNDKYNDLSSTLFYYDNNNLKISNIILPRATCNNYGTIKPDNITIKIDNNGIISGNQSVDLSSYATKNDLDTASSGITFMEPADLATTTNLSYPFVGIIQVDGINVESNNRILIKNQNLKKQNGIYIASSSTWNRSADFNNINNIKVGSFVFVKNGNINKNSGFVFNTSNFTTLDTDDINFVQFSSAGQILGGTGIVKDINTINLNIKENGGIIIDNNNKIQINLSLPNIAGVLDINKGGTGSTELTNLINLSTHTNGILPETKGGTGTNTLNNLIDLSLHTNGILPASKGGTGKNILVANQIIVGNNSDSVIQSEELKWNNTTNTLSATNITGTGSNITHINTDNISSGILPIIRGGTGVNTLNLSQLVVGNGTSAPIQSPNLTWNNTTNTLSATNISGLGSDISQINANNISSGILPIIRGGTGVNTLNASQIVVGNGISAPIQSPNLTWNNTTNTLSATNITGAGSNITHINTSNITSGILPIVRGGTGVNTLNASQIVVGNGISAPIQSQNLTWNNTTNTLSATNITGAGSNITHINTDNITSGILPIVRGGTGSNILIADMIEHGFNKRFIENNTISIPSEELNINKILNIGANIIPTLDNIFSIGAPDKKWKSIYVGASTIHIGTTKISASSTGALEMSSISFEDKINLITSNELHSLSGINKNVQQQINELNLDNIANGNTNKYIINGLYNGSISVYSNLNVGTYHSTQNPNGNLHVFGDLILEGDITTFNPLITQVHRHLSNYNTGYIDIYNIDDSSNKPSIKIKHNSGYSNIFECYSKNDIELNNAVFIISSNGNIGINNNLPVENLDIIGNIKYTGKINNITAEELSHLSGINYNIKQKINNNDLYQSNYVKQTSNILNTDFSNKIYNVSNYISDINLLLTENIIISSNSLYIYSSNININLSNLLFDTIITISNSLENNETNLSNYILSTSNELFAHFDANDINLSNYIYNTSNELFTYFDANDINLSNYIYNTSNELIELIFNNGGNQIDFILETSNILYNFSYNNDNNQSNFIILTSNILSSNLMNFSKNANNITEGKISSELLPIASETILGSIKQGNNTTIDTLTGAISINLSSYEGDTIIIGDLTTSNFTALGSSTILDTNVYITKKLELINDSLNTAVDIKQSTNNYNIMNISNLTNEVFNIDYNGNITFHESINNINITQFSKIADISTNDSNVSNYVDVVNTRISGLISINDSNVSNYVDVVNTRVAGLISTKDSNISNYVDVVNTRVSGLISTNDSNVSNYVSSTSNYLATSITDLYRLSYDDQNVFNLIENSNYTITSNKLQLPIASSTVLGGIKKGNNINIQDGIISVNLSSYVGDTVIDGRITASNLTVLGSSTILDTNVYITERLEIINDSLNNAVNIKQTKPNYNIMNVSNLSSEVFNIDYDGNITFQGTINNINKTQFSKIAEITINDTNVSNYVGAVNTRVSGLISTNDTNVSNYVYNTSNIIVSSVNSKGYLTANTIPFASTTVLGGVKVDGSTITINGSGVISGAPTLIAGTNISIEGGAINNTYSLPTSSTTVLGGVKVDGSTITINGSGVISGSPALTAGTNISIVGGAINNTYSLPTSSTTVLGGVKVDGTTITINGSGVISGASTYSLPTSSTTVLGGVKVDGSTITINGSGVISTASGSSQWTTSGVDIYNVNSGNVGIGTNVPSAFLDIVKTHAASTVSDLLNMRFDSNWGLKIQQNYSVAGNIQYDFIHRYNAVNYNLLTFKGNNVGIGTNNPTEQLHVSGNFKSGGSIVGGGDIMFENNIFTTSSTGRLAIGINPASSSGNHIHLHRSTANTEIKLQFTDGTTLTNTTDGLALFKGTDQNGYLWNYENNALIFGTNASERLRVAADGNVGIGTNNPLNTLDINGNLLVRAYGTTGSGTKGIFFRSDHTGASLQYNCSILTFDHSGGGPTDGISINGYSGVSICTGANTRQERLRVAADGNVGIGTNTLIESKCTINPIVIDRSTFNHSEAPLTITQPTATSSTVLNDPKSVLHLCRQGTNSQAHGARATFKLCRYENSSINSRTRLDLLLSHNSYDEAASISFRSDGNVGIGTTNPLYKLEVAGTTLLNGQVYVGAAAGSSTIFLGGGAAGDATYDHSVIETRLYSSSENTELVIFKGNDIGTPSAADRIRLRAGAIVFDTFPGASVDRTAENIRMVIDGSGNVGIGINPAADRLHVSGGNILSTGDVIAYYSDERLKNIKSYIKDVLPTLDEINVFKYNSNNLGESFGYDKDKDEIGLSAQEILKHYPELINLAPFDTTYDSTTNKKISKSGENYLTLNYTRLVPILLQGIKELNNKNKNMDNELRELKEKYTNINEKYTNMEEELKELKTLILNR